MSRAHIARAVLDGIALQISDILSAMSTDAGTPLTELKVDGGAARNDLLMKFQADVLGVTCVRPTVLETTALGAAFLAGLGAGVWNSTDAIREAWQRTVVSGQTWMRRSVRPIWMCWAAAVSRA